MSCLTSLDDKDWLPISTDFVSKIGKKSPEMKKYFLERVKLIQTCRRCMKYAKSHEHIVNDTALCDSLCEDCIRTKAICQSCAALGQTSHIPTLRACGRCLSDNVLCSKLAVLVLVVDCESGNKGAMMELRRDIMNDTIDPDISLLSLFPDPRIIVLQTGG